MGAQRTRILLTGGAGYIGSHTYVALVEAGFCPVIADDFSNSHPAVVQRLAQLTAMPVLCERGDVCDTHWVQTLLARHAIAGVIHFAGFKAVGESVAQPLRYYQNNVGGILSVLRAMQAAGCHTLVFSSTATVYGDPQALPVPESAPLNPGSPYAHSKLVCEQIIQAHAASAPAWRTACLRYFNPVGAHPSGLIGENPNGVPNNLMPYITQVALGQRPCLQVYGNDYPTPDGTGVRDYIHVQDLVHGHVAALRMLLEKPGNFTLNLGAGCGHSVLDVVRAFEHASGQSIALRFVPRRAGDVARYYADASQAQQVLGWRAAHSLAQMCADAWRWQQGNPQGYAGHADQLHGNIQHP